MDTPSVQTWRAMDQAQKDAVFQQLGDAQKQQLQQELLASPPAAAPPAAPPESAPVPAAAPAQPVETPTGTPTPAPAQAPPGTTASGAGFTGALQGATFNFSEEIGGGLRAIVPGGEGYQEYVNRQRALQAQQQAEHPGAYLAGEIGGALASTFVPGVGWVSGPARAAQVTTKLGRVGTSLVRGAVTGGTETVAGMTGKAEGDIFDRAGEVASNPADIAIGMGGGAVGEAFLGPAIGYITQRFGASTARSVEKNLRAIAEESGLSTDEIVRRIGEGEVFAGMTDSTRVAARAIKDKSAAAGQTMTDATRGRVAARQGEAIGAVETALTGQPPTQSLHRQAAEQLERQRRESGNAFGIRRDTAVVSDPAELAGAIDVAVQREPGVATRLNEFYRRTGQPPLFDDAGRLLREPSIADAEHLTRSLNESAENLASSTNSSASVQSAQALRDVANALRAAVDRQAGPVGPGQLVGPRSAVSGAIEAEATGFPLGLDKTMSTRPGSFNEEYRVLTPEGQQGTRLGAATAIRAEGTRGATANTLIDRLMETNLEDAAGAPVERWAGQNVRTMIGDEAKDAIGPTLERAKREQVLLDRLQGGPNTAERMVAQEALATRTAGTGNMFDALEQATGGGVASAATKGLRSILGSAQELDDAQLQELAGYMMSTDPDLMRAALAGDGAAMSTVRELANNILSKVGRRQAVVAGANAAPALLDYMGGP